MMAGIRGKNTRIEIMIRRGLFERGLRYRIHNARLPGKPDLSFTKHKAAIFVNGCFWHSHECSLFKWPSSNADFWRNKLLRNRETDYRKHAALEEAGWRVLTIWECVIRLRRRPLELVVAEAAAWVINGKRSREVT
jgi:DNA mismatch endonuclease (patch repair protein)